VAAILGVADPEISHGMIEAAIKRRIKNRVVSTKLCGELNDNISANNPQSTDDQKVRAWII